MPRALLSVSKKNGLVDFARALAARGFELVSTGGTARALADAGLAVTSVAAITGFPEMLDGRVKTLHPNVHGGILARRDRHDDLAALEAHGIGLIDIVVVNLYPFEETAARPGVAFEELVEQIDIGGPSMVRAAAKNFRNVLVVVDPTRYRDVLSELDKADGPSIAFRFLLAREAFGHTARYDAAIAQELAGFAMDERGIERTAAGPEGAALLCDLRKLRDLGYGENPHQRAALYAGRSREFEAWEILQGKDLSYTNLLDLDASLRIALEFTEPAAAVVKHTNTCGVATGSSAAEAYQRARDADAVAAYGGIVALNRSIDVEVAQAVTSTFIEAVIAPAVDEAARPLLARKGNMRVVLADFERLRSNRGEAGADEMRSTLAGTLVQERDRVREAQTAWDAD